MANLSGYFNSIDYSHKYINKKKHINPVGYFDYALTYGQYLSKKNIWAIEIIDFEVRQKYEFT